MKIVFKCSKPRIGWSASTDRLVAKLWFTKEGILEYIFVWELTWFNAEGCGDAEIDYTVDQVLDFLSKELEQYENCEEVIEE